MILSAVKYASVYPCLRFLRSRLLGRAEYDALLRASSFEQALEVLRGTVYGDILAECGAGDIEGVEHALRTVMLRDLRELAHLSRGRLARHLSLFAAWFDLLNVKTAVRALHALDSPRAVESRLFDTAPVGQVDAEKLAASDNFLSVQAALAGTIFHDEFGEALPWYREEGDVFFLEAALDRAFFVAMARHDARMNRWNVFPRSRILILKFRYENLFGLTRLRYVRRMEVEEVCRFILHECFPGSRDETARVFSRAMQEHERSTGFLAELVRRYFPGVLRAGREEGKEDPGHIARALKEFLYERAGRTFLLFPFQSDLVAAFLLMREYEVDNLVSILESKEMNLPPERVVPLLVGYG